MNIVAQIQQQLLQTLFQALATSGQPLKAGDTVSAAFIGWADDRGAQTGAPAAAQVRIGAQNVTLLLAADSARRAALAPGAVLTLQVDEPAEGGAPAAMRLLSVTPAAGQGSSQASGASIPMAGLASQRQQLPAMAPAQAAAEAARAAAGPVAGAALARQDSFAPLFANLQAIVHARGALPASVMGAALRVLSLRLPLQAGAAAPEALRQAVGASGVFHEARLALGQAAEAAGDLKSALLALRLALSEQVRGSGPVALTLPGEAEARAAGGQEAGASAKPQSHAQPQQPVRTMAPQRDGLPAAQGFAPASIDPASQSLPAMLGKLLEGTDSALDRLTLAQYASLPTSAETANGAPLHRWHVELPVQLDGRTAVLPLDIEEDRGGGAVEGPQAKIWRVRFALDVEPMGPVHALVTMQGKVIGVSVWAERDATSQLVRDFSPDLEAALLDSDFERAAIDVITGQPMRRAAHAGHYLDRRS